MEDGNRIMASTATGFGKTPKAPNTVGGNPYAPTSLSPLTPAQIPRSLGLSPVTTAHKPAGTHEAFMLLILQVVAIIALSVAAEQGKGLRRAALGIVVILWLVWLMNNATTTQKFFDKVVPRK